MHWFLADDAARDAEAPRGSVRITGRVDGVGAGADEPVPSEPRGALSADEASASAASTPVAAAPEPSTPRASTTVAVAPTMAAKPTAPVPLKGLSKGLPYPVRGDVQGRFGMDRPEGGTWRGIVLRSSEGTRVAAVAPGRVVYAGWLAGFGNLMIVDHGEKFLTVYAYNQSLLKQVGENVAAGEAIATVGATGGQVEPGLYFEIRQGGKPVNPLLWLGG